MNELNLPAAPPLPDQVRERALQTVLNEIDDPRRRRRTAPMLAAAAPILAGAVVVGVLGGITSTALVLTSPPPNDPGVLTAPAALTAPAVAPPTTVAPTAVAPTTAPTTAPPTVGQTTVPPTVPPATVIPPPPIGSEVTATPGPSSDTPPAGSIESATCSGARSVSALLRLQRHRGPRSQSGTGAELHQRCDLAPIEWVGDCYAARPPQFVAGDEGCARLPGYLAVFHGPPTDGNSLHLFTVGDDSWTIRPESG